MKNLKDVKKYIESIRHIFLCEEFDLEIVETDSTKEILATMAVRYDYLDATLTIYPRFYKDTEDVQKKTLVHEMCHFITLLQHHLMCDLLNGNLVTEKHADSVLERENSWIERILCNSLKKEFGL